MPLICRFNGIRVYLPPSEHPPPHFHAEYAEYVVLVDIQTLAVTEGRFPRSQERRLLNWAAQRQDELMNAWNTVRRGELPGRIAPLSTSS